MMENFGASQPDPAPSEPDIRRRRTLLDILYLLVLLGLYCVSLGCPFAGIVLGVTLQVWGATDETRRVGRTCLILGIVNLVLSLLLLAVLASVGGLLSRMPLLYREGL